MIFCHDSDQLAGDAAIDGVDKPERVTLTVGESLLAAKAAGAEKAPGVQPAHDGTTQFGFDRPRAVGNKQLSLAVGKDAYVARVIRETLRRGGSTSRPDGRQLPAGPNVYVVSEHGHEKRVARDNLRPQIDTYISEKRAHFGDPTVFFGTWLDWEDVVCDLSVPCPGLLQALTLGHANRQTAIYHPASKGCLQVPNSQELNRIAGACSYAQRKSLPDALACVDASLLQLPQDVYVSVLDLITSIMSSPPDDVTEESLEQLQRICKRPSEVVGSYANWLGVALAHAVHQREKASAEPSGERVLLATV